MGATAIKYIVTAFSMKREIKLLFFTLLVLCMIPVFAVIIITQAGIDLVSGALVSRDQESAQVDIHDPATGEIIDHISAPVIWPIGGRVSLEFGQSDLPYQPYHTGIDLASPNHKVGDPVVAFMKGTVTYAGETSWGFGKHVVLDNGQHVTSTYGHLDSITAQVGQEVEIGTILGTRGSTGWSTGPHLHFQINVYGIPVNPRTFFTGDPPNE